jgi:peptidoglycan hydrolase CwlO-like protein
MDENVTKEFPQDEILKTILTELRSVKTQLNTIDNRLTTLEEKVDRRLMETRPIWEAILEQLQETNVRLDNLEKKVDSLEKKLDNLDKKVDSLEKKVDSLEKKVDSLEIDFKDFRRWIRKNYFELGQEQLRFDERLENLEEALPRQ